MHPQIPRAEASGHPACRSTRANDHRWSRPRRLSPRDVWRLIRALPGERRLLSPLPSPHRRTGWTPRSRRQDHTTSPYAALPSLACKKHATSLRPSHSNPTCR